MKIDHELIIKAYKAFNERDIESALSTMEKNVCWPNGWEGGYVEGHEAVRNYWTRQWKEINPEVTPVSIHEKEDGRIEVEVHQVVKDKKGNALSDSTIRHIFTVHNNRIARMDIEPL